MIKIDFSKVVKTFKKTGYLIIINNDGNGDQWLGNGAAFYNMGNTEFDTINVKPVLPARSPEWTIVSDNVKRYTEVYFDDNDYTEEPIEKILPLDFTYNEKDFETYVLNSRDVMFIDKSYLKPIDIGNSSGAVFYSRKSKIYGNYLAIKDGLMLKAIIMPTKLVNADDTLFADLIDELHELCMIARGSIAEVGEE